MDQACIDGEVRDLSADSAFWTVGDDYEIERWAVLISRFAGMI